MTCLSFAHRRAAIGLTIPGAEMRGEESCLLPCICYSVLATKENHVHVYIWHVCVHSYCSDTSSSSRPGSILGFISANFFPDHIDLLTLCNYWM